VNIAYNFISSINASLCKGWCFKIASQSHYQLIYALFIMSLHYISCVYFAFSWIVPNPVFILTMLWIHGKCDIRQYVCTFVCNDVVMALTEIVLTSARLQMR